MRILRGFLGLLLLVVIARWFCAPTRNDLGGN